MNELTIIHDTISNKIHIICGLQVMLDRELAELYEIETKVISQVVKRNIEILLSDDELIFGFEKQAKDIFTKINQNEK